MPCALENARSLLLIETSQRELISPPQASNAVVHNYNAICPAAPPRIAAERSGHGWPSTICRASQPLPRERCKVYPPKARAILFRDIGCSPTRDSSLLMYLSFLFGVVCALAHHLFYAFLDGKLVEKQSVMLRYGTVLAYASKAGFSSAIITAFNQRVWVTVRSRFMSIKGLDSLFAATSNMMAMLNLEFLAHAKQAFTLALIAWLTPLVVILTSNTLLVEQQTKSLVGLCPAVRSLNFTFEETSNWRYPTQIGGQYETPLSIWNITSENVSDPYYFDYYTGEGTAIQQTTTLGAFLEEVVPLKNASATICGSGWNCTYTIAFTGPGYDCKELASGVGSKVQNLTQESGEAVAPFGTDILLPEGHWSYYAFTSGGEYATAQLKDVQQSGIPYGDGPFPEHLGALRTEPVIWIGYVELNNPNATQLNRTDPGWNDAFTPKIFACEHKETQYEANFTYISGTQTARITKQTFGSPIINTTYLPHVMADDGTNDNTTATPESNYVMPTDVAHYRKTAAYHSIGKMLRAFINGTIAVSDTLIQPIENTQAVQTKLIDELTNYFPHTNIMERVQGLYQDMILSMFSNPQYVEVVWAARPYEQTGSQLMGGTGEDDLDYLYPCIRWQSANTYVYEARILWLVYGITIILSLACVVVGALAIRDNGGVQRNTRFSSIVAATRGPALDKIAWQGPLQDRGDVPSDVKKLKLGYGVMRDMDSRHMAAMDLCPDPYLVVDEDNIAPSQPKGYPRPGRSYTSAYLGELRCGFALKGDVDQRHREGSLFHK
ncbi:hypothetical protein BD289DRAFT_464321 [Coniella lustricola]|uniref:Formylmethionine deformylase-like protein n=1 Tax=Coniella lustricola TaxID=2025994 RepID=A0A2T3ANY9_9PEZI|nr:hypothetical protein BD289DRAFT_464321 [Coniella lustricola]